MTLDAPRTAAAPPRSFDTGSDATPGGYLRLATPLPDWLGGSTPGQAVAACEAASAIGRG